METSEKNEHSSTDDRTITFILSSKHLKTHQNTKRKVTQPTHNQQYNPCQQQGEYKYETTG